VIEGMKKNKKILAASLATTLVLGSVAGLPLSAQGLLSSLGGIAAAQALNTDIMNQLSAVYDELDATEKAAIEAARTKLKNNEIVKYTDTALVTEIWNGISAKGTLPTVVTQAHLIHLIKQLGIFYDPTFSDLQEAIQDPFNRELLTALAGLAGFSGGNDFTQSDVLEFANAVKAELTSIIASRASELISIGTDTAQLKALAAEAIDNVRTKTATKDLDVSKLLTGLDITGADLVAVHDRFAAIVDPQHAAEKALAAGYVRSESVVTVTTEDNGRKATPALTVFGQVVPNELITWTVVESGAKITALVTDVFVLDSSVASGVETAVHIQAAILGKVIYTGELKMKYTAPVVDDGDDDDDDVTPGPVTPPAEPKAPNLEKALEKITENIAKIADMVKNPNAGNGLKKAQEAIQEVIREAAKIDVSSTVKVEGDVAKPNLDNKKVADVFKTVKDIAKAANDKLKEAAPDAKPAKVIATLDLGTVNAGTTQIPLSKEILAAAKENGIDTIAIQVNGITLAVDVDQLAGAATTVTVKKEEKSVATSATQLKVASDVYEFNFVSDGKEIESFSKPVEVKIPMPAIAAGVDTDLLVLAKIQDGQLIFKGGQYNAEKKEFAAMNKSFSTYAVIENKVSFQDTTSVESWAGRQIAVVAAKGIVEGRAAGQFVPEGQVTRAEFAKLIVKAFGLEDAAATESFADVSDNEWFKPYVAAAVKAGLVEGRTDTSFAPNANITRAEMATLASRALTKIKEYKAPVNNDALKAFADAASINATLTSGVALAADQGIVVGEEGGKFNPNANSTRAQAAVVIYRLLNK
jgi:hypothetical protein